LKIYLRRKALSYSKLTRHELVLKGVRQRSPVSSLFAEPRDYLCPADSAATVASVPNSRNALGSSSEWDDLGFAVTMRVDQSTASRAVCAAIAPRPASSAELVSYDLPVFHVATPRQAISIYEQ
jgi:hypothetical protein